MIQVYAVVSSSSSHLLSFAVTGLLTSCCILLQCRRWIQFIGYTFFATANFAFLPVMPAYHREWAMEIEYLVVILAFVFSRYPQYKAWWAWQVLKIRPPGQAAPAAPDNALITTIATDVTTFMDPIQEVLPSLPDIQYSEYPNPPHHRLWQLCTCHPGTGSSHDVLGHASAKNCVCHCLSAAASDGMAGVGRPQTHSLHPSAAPDVVQLCAYLWQLR
jgi:hypothetical protein